MSGAAGAPHALSEEDTYKDYVLPRGAIILPNIWYVRFFGTKMSSNVTLGKFRMTHAYILNLSYLSRNVF